LTDLGQGTRGRPVEMEVREGGGGERRSGEKSRKRMHVSCGVDGGV
jgi:hypothetical protein